MFAFLINLILLIIFVAFVIVCVTAFRIYRSLHNIKRKFNSASGRNGSSRQRYGGRTDDDEVIIDRRTPDEANRKIFSKNEGEYVDFEEKK